MVSRVVRNDEIAGSNPAESIILDTRKTLDIFHMVLRTYQ